MAFNLSVQILSASGFHIEYMEEKASESRWSVMW